MHRPGYHSADAETAEVFRVELPHPTGTGLVRLIGELDIATAPQLKRLITSLPVGSGRDVTVDFSDLTYIDAAGLGALLEVRQAVRAAGGSLILTGVSAFTRRLLHITGLDQVFEIRADVGTYARLPAEANDRPYHDRRARTAFTSTAGPA
jgi:anti-anti-sigma factor